ncbi:MAG: hypothetical protein WCQ65_10675 [Fermentimonas sp.]|jgi:predicted RNA-binding Zn-ribbon protein involved in translation (DUF1610 family)
MEEVNVILTKNICKRCGGELEKKVSFDTGDTSFSYLLCPGKNNITIYQCKKCKNIEVEI